MKALAPWLRTLTPFAWRLFLLVVGAGAVAHQAMVRHTASVGRPEGGLVSAMPVRQEDSARVAKNYPDVAERPLFHANRQRWQPPPPRPPPQAPPPAPVVAAPAPPPLPRNLLLVGVIGGVGNRAALIRAESGQILILREGQEVQGWRLRSILLDRLQLEANEAEYELGFRPSR